jgi:guanylate kinase
MNRQAMLIVRRLRSGLQDDGYINPVFIQYNKIPRAKAHGILMMLASRDSPAFGGTDRSSSLLLVGRVLRSVSIKSVNMAENNINTKGLLLVITGPPASGKDTVVKELLNDSSLGFTRIVSYATREKREGEIEGVDHYFVSEDRFQSLRKSGNLIEHVRSGTTWKGTPKEPFLNIIHQDHKCIWRIDPFRSAKTKTLFYKHFGKRAGQLLYDKTVTIFINVTNKEMLKKRWMDRKKDEDINQFEIRYKKDMEVFNKLKQKYDYIVDNEGTVSDTVREIKNILYKTKLTNG